MNRLVRVWNRFEEGAIVFLLAAMTLVTFLYVVMTNVFTLFYDLGDRLLQQGGHLLPRTGSTFAQRRPARAVDQGMATTVPRGTRSKSCSTSSLRMRTQPALLALPSELLSQVPCRP